VRTCQTHILKQHTKIGRIKLVSATMDFIPPSSWDVHVHVFDPVRHPYIPDTLYTPPARSTADLIAATPTTNFVIVMSGPEGTNTAQTVEAMEQLRKKGHEAKGVVVMDTNQMTPDELRRLDQAGVRSVRFNTRRDGMALDGLFEETARRISAAGVKWSIESAIFDVGVWHGLIPILRRLHEEHGTVFVADHVFAAQPSELGSDRFTDLLALVEEGIIVVKISGLTRYGRDAEPMMPVIREVLARRDGKGGIYGSDWPHVISKPGATGLMQVDIGEHLQLLKGVCDQLEKQTWERLMRDNAKALYA
jgi:predicted TIM-barrel fold metal-dependent hydrolase